MKKIDFNKNYYSVLDLDPLCSSDDIKKSYRKLSFSHHPDKGGDPNNFDEIKEAYDVLLNEESREKYNTHSIYGTEYKESLNFLDYEFDDLKNGWDRSKLDDFKKKNGLNIVVKLKKDFVKGSISYERFLICKKCNGSGKDLQSNIVIKDENGKVIKIFDGENGCDFCEGTGKYHMGGECAFCSGKGKIGSVDCGVCKGTRRILGKQKINKIVFDINEKSKKIEFMGNFSSDGTGGVGNLWLVRKD